MKKLKKIIYFDEMSATDYIVISAGGIKEFVKKTTNEKNKETNANVEAGLEAKGFLPFWASFIQAKSSMKGTIGVEYIGKDIVNTYISNTVLTDFIEEVQKNEKSDIQIFSNLKTEAYTNSLTYLKMYAPYLKILKNPEEFPLNISEINEILEGAKGYYELIGIQDNSTKIILRFNLNAFRNNYSLNDIIKMNLTYYTIKVGQYSESKLNIAEEFPQEVAPDALEILSKNSDVNNEEKLLDVHDVILAGIEA